MRRRLIMLIALVAAVLPGTEPGTAGIDALVSAELVRRNLAVAPRCEDAVFIRRVFLDLIGSLPTPAEVRAFLKRTDPGKRSALVDSLLVREEFSLFQALRWGDLLRIKSEFPSNLWPNAVQLYHHWLVESFRANKPVDVLARDLLTATGSDFRDPPANFWRGFQERTPRRYLENVAVVFMGLRLERSGWTDRQIAECSAFFSQVAFKKTDEWKEEIVMVDRNARLMAADGHTEIVPRTPDGALSGVGSDLDRRKAFAAWLTAPANPWFAKAQANRLWFHLLGRGIVHEPDDMGPQNPPWNAALLDHLAAELSGHGWDLRHLCRIIAASETYQRASGPAAGQVPDPAGCAHHRLRRMEAEVLLDALCLITQSGERYVSPIPEPFTYLPPDQRAIGLADSSVESPFLSLFGRPSRNTSFASEREAPASALQAQHLINSTQVEEKIRRAPFLTALANSGKVAPPQAVDEIWLRILSRLPTDEERKIAMARIESNGTQPRLEALVDLAWALINACEFQIKP